MDHQNNLAEYCYAMAMQKVFAPEMYAEVPDPGDDFEGCLGALIDKVTLDTLPMSVHQMDTYFRKRAKELLQWCKDNPDKAPGPMVERIQAWHKSMYI